MCLKVSIGTKKVLKTIYSSLDYLSTRLDPEELKALLRKHSEAFTDEEIVELGELYYSAKAGGSVRFDKFIEAVDRVVAGVNGSTNPSDEVKYEDKAEHFRTSGRHPLGVGRDGGTFIKYAKFRTCCIRKIK